MVEREMDDAIRSGSALLEAVWVRDRPAIDLGAGGGQRRRLFVRTAEAEHLMAAPINSLTTAEPMNPVAPVTNTRMGKVSIVSPETNVCSRVYPGKVVSLSWYNG